MKWGKNSRGIFLSAGVLAALWALAAFLVKKPFLPGPAAVAQSFIALIKNGTLLPHILASLFRILAAFLISAVPAALLGLAAGRSRRLDAFLSPLIYLVHPLPKAAFLPVIMLFLGLGEASKIFLLGFIIFSQILVAARDAAKQVPGECTASVKSLGADRRACFIHVVVPASLPALFTSVRVSLGTAAAVLFLAETFATDSGLGYLIVDAWARIAYAEMYAAIGALSLLGLALFLLTDLAETCCCPWEER
jgi:NitT/TauT family transport system permease protein